MTDETLAKLIVTFDRQKNQLKTDRVGHSVLHHELDHNSGLREAGFDNQGHLFVYYDMSIPVSGAFFWLNNCSEHGHWDIHLYIQLQHRRKGYASDLFLSGVRIWLSSNGYEREQITTTACSPHSAQLSANIGFVKDSGHYVYDIGNGA